MRAAAIVAAEPVIRAQPYKVTIAVATVVVFGTLSMFLYPFLSLGILPPDMRILLTTLASLFLASAMSAVGLRTRISAIKEAGMKPLLLAAFLTLFLIVGGYVVNIAIL